MSGATEQRPAPDGAWAVEAEAVVKTYDGRPALRGVTLRVARGAVHAVVGENGAGKSTLMKTLSGLVRPDAGVVRVGGTPLPASPAEAIRRGVGMVHQHFMLVPELTVAENLVLGAEPRRGPLLDIGRAAREIAAVGERWGLRVDPAARTGDLSVGELQRVEIVKILYRGAEVLILDEPTAVLTPLEVRELFAVLRQLVSAGRTILLVTHKLDEVMDLAGRIAVLRRGEVVLETEAAVTAPVELSRAMVGRTVALARDAPPADDGTERPVMLEVRDLRARRPDGADALRGVSLAVRAGEILGVAGVEGNGQTELALAVCGLVEAEAGQVLLGGEDVTRLSPRARLARGLAHVPEDRQVRGLVLELPLGENLALGREVAAGARGPLLPPRRLRKAARDLLQRFDVSPAEPDLPARALSGGNQQKVVAARALARTPRVLVAAQPTRGVDVGAIETLWAELRAARAAGAAILLSSAELTELRALADRILVLYRGCIVGERPAGTPIEELGALMTGAAGTEAIG